MAPIQAKKIAVRSQLTKRNSNKPASISKSTLNRTSPVAQRTTKNNNWKGGMVVRGLKQLMLGSILMSEVSSNPTTATDRSKDKYNVLRKLASPNKPQPVGQPPRKRPVLTRPAIQRKPSQVLPFSSAPPGKKLSPLRPSRIPFPTLVHKPPFKVPFAITPVGQLTKTGGELGSGKQRTPTLARQNSHFFTPPTAQPTRAANTRAKMTTSLSNSSGAKRPSRILARPSAPTPLAAGKFRSPPSKLFLPRPCPLKRSYIDASIFGASDRSSAMEDACLDMMSPSPSPPSLQLHQVFGEMIILGGKASKDDEETTLAICDSVVAGQPDVPDKGEYQVMCKTKPSPNGDMATDFAQLPPSVSMKNIKGPGSETALPEMLNGCGEPTEKVEEKVDSDVESKVVKNLMVNKRENSISDEMPGFVDELKNKLKSRRGEVQPEKIPFSGVTDNRSSPAKAYFAPVPLPKHRSVDVRKASTKMNEGRRGAHTNLSGKNATVHKKIAAKPTQGSKIMSDSSSNRSSTATALSEVTNLHAQEPNPILLSERPPSVNSKLRIPTELVHTAFGTRVRRVVIPPHVDDRLPSRDARIQMELKSLRERKKVGGGLYELSREEGLSLTAQGIISKVKGEKAFAN